MVQLVVSHVQALVSADASQEQQLASLNAQLERLLAERSRAAEILTTALHGRHSPDDAEAAVSRAGTASQSGQTADSQVAELPQGASMTQLAESAVTMIRDSAAQLSQTQGQLQQVLHQLTDAQQESAGAESKVQAALEKAQNANHQLQSLQRSSQQVNNLCPDSAQLSPSLLVVLVVRCV